VNIVGGCCGTTPEHIAAIAAAVEGVAPRLIPHKGHEGQPANGPEDHFTQFAGLETLTIRPDSNFQMIGERTNVTGSARFARLIRAGDYAAAVQVALDQVQGSANLIDVNMDEACSTRATMGVPQYSRRSPGSRACVHGGRLK
jgi:5-methyltetrahydrofolate--homocysteine methyltransferase